MALHASYESRKSTIAERQCPASSLNAFSKPWNVTSTRAVIGLDLAVLAVRIQDPRQPDKMPNSYAIPNLNSFSFIAT